MSRKLLFWISLIPIFSFGCAKPTPIPLTPITAQKVLAYAKDSEGKLTLINAWATWCKPCVDEFPLLLSLREEYQPKGIYFLFANVDFPSEKNQVIRFLNQMGVSFETYMKDQNDEEFIDGLYEKWNGSIPAFFLLNDSGRVLEFWEGETEEAKLRAILDRYVRKGEK